MIHASVVLSVPQGAKPYGLVDRHDRQPNVYNHV